MSSDIAKAVDSLPGWAIPATVGGVVLLALFQNQSGGTRRGSQGLTTVYAPVPADPGLISLAEREVEARRSVYTSALSGLISRDISDISADRDVTISGINASVANARTRASEALGLAQTEAQTRVSLQNARTAAYIADSQGATRKYEAKQATKRGIADTIGGVIKTGLSFLFG